jgi:hypothetical protein
MWLGVPSDGCPLAAKVLPLHATRLIGNHFRKLTLFNLVLKTSVFRGFVFSTSWRQEKK